MNHYYAYQPVKMHLPEVNSRTEPLKRSFHISLLSTAVPYICAEVYMMKSIKLKGLDDSSLYIFTLLLSQLLCETRGNISDVSENILGQ